ncbi:hypothetical protein [Helicobacter sp. MIT 05-5294]|nr:hypothetical protein [Helicobacter sp. MIT 05-5294]
MPKLSIIIPFGISIEREFIKDRVINKAKTLRSDEKCRSDFRGGIL